MFITAPEVCEMESCQIADAEVVETDGSEVSTAVVPQPRHGEVLRPFDVAEQRDAMDAYQRGLREILTDDDWQGQPGGKGSFVKKSGWRKIAAWFDLSVELGSDAGQEKRAVDAH